MDVANELACYWLTSLCYDGSAFCVLPWKAIRKVNTVKNSQEHGKLNSKSHGSVSSYTGIQNVTGYDMFKSLALPEKCKELEAFQKKGGSVEGLKVKEKG